MIATADSGRRIESVGSGCRDWRLYTLPIGAVWSRLSASVPGESPRNLQARSEVEMERRQVETSAGVVEIH